MLAGGGTTVSDLKTLIDQPALFGEAASVATAHRALAAVDDAALARIGTARAAARAAGADPGFYVIDIDATLVNAHSDKEGAAPNYKRGFGFHPILSFLDATGEPLAAKLRPGNAVAHAGADLVEVLEASLAQLPVDPAVREMVMRSDSAGLNHVLLDSCKERNVRFVVGHDLTEPIRKALWDLPTCRWVPAVSPDGSEESEHAEVAEITDLLGLSRWPEGIRAIARREPAHPGAQLNFTDIDGRR